MANNPTKQITAEERKLLNNGRAKIVFRGHLVDIGDDQQPISVYVSDKDDVKSSETCPLIFRTKFIDGAACANLVDFLYMKGGKEISVDVKSLETTFTRGQDFVIILHVQPKNVQLEINWRMQKITPDRPIGYGDAHFVFVTGNGMENSSIEILPEDPPCGQAKK